MTGTEIVIWWIVMGCVCLICLIGSVLPDIIVWVEDAPIRRANKAQVKLKEEKLKVEIENKRIREERFVIYEAKKIEERRRIAIKRNNCYR